ncbi:hypothetical protein ALC53_04386, partial [Atta colombica]
REILIFCFNMKKSAAEAHRMLSNTYGETAISERTCQLKLRRVIESIESRHPAWVILEDSIGFSNEPGNPSGKDDILRLAAMI